MQEILIQMQYLRIVIKFRISTSTMLIMLVKGGTIDMSFKKMMDKAIKAADKFTVWESDEYDDIYVSYEAGTYVLYVEGRPQADGPQQRMIQLAKREERMRG